MTNNDSYTYTVQSRNFSTSQPVRIADIAAQPQTMITVCERTSQKCFVLSVADSGSRSQFTTVGSAHRGCVVPETNAKVSHLSLSDVFFQALNTPKLIFRPGPHWGSLRRSPDPLVGWRGQTPPHTLSSRRLRRVCLGVFGFSVVTPPHQHKFLATPMNVRELNVRPYKALYHT